MTAMQIRTRAASIAVGLAMSMVAIEVLLRIGSGFMSPRPLDTALTTSQSIVCIGDSNTYGLYLSRDEAWPAQVAARWPDGPDIVNISYPGLNSSRLLDLLPTILAARPALLLVMIGVNDFWTEPDTPTLGAWFWRHSRFYRLLFMLVRSSPLDVTISGSADRWRDPAEIQPKAWAQKEDEARVEGIPFRLGWRRVEDPAVASDWQQRLDANLFAIAALARETGIPLAFLTYPADRNAYGIVNERLRAAAAASGAPLIDVNRAFETICSDGCPDFLYDDDHPTAAGHARAASVIVDALRQRNVVAAQ